MTSKHLRSTAACGAFVLAAIAAPSAMAQTATGASKPTGGNVVAGELEIVVTAQKREQRLSDVGMTITAVSADRLQEQGVTDVTQLVRIVPGLSFFTTTTATPVYSLRGVGFNESSLAAYPAVSVYQDEIPLPFPAMAAQAGLDPARVEVLKGPQGTLFGQNSTAGAINYVTATPTDEFDAGFNVGIGRFNTVDANGFVSGPLTDTLGARLSISGVRGDGWQESYVRPGDTLGDRDTTAARLLLQWDPTSHLRVRMNVNAWRDRSEPTAAQLVAVTPGTPALVSPALLAYPRLPKDDARLADWDPAWNPSADDTFWQTAVRADYDFANGLQLTSITSYADYVRDQRTDLDGTQLKITDSTLSGRIRSVFQELRLSNSDDADTRWIVGANYGSDKVIDRDLFGFADASGGRAFGFGFAGFYSDQEMRNYAAFANVEHDIGDAITLKGGLRFTRAERDLNGMCSFDVGDGGAAGAFTFIARLFNPAAPTIAPGQCFTLNPATFTAGLFTSTLNEENVSWRAGIDYKLTEDTLLYFNVARGFKAGGFPTVQASFTTQYVPVTEESVLDYEGGVKTTFWGGRGTLEAAAFYYDYKDKQVRAKLIDPVFGPLEALQNIPESEVLGAEAAVALAPIDGLTMGLSATYLDAKITRFTGVNAAGILANFAGAPMPQTPEWQIAANADYEWRLSDALSAFVGGNITHHDATYAGIGTDPIPTGVGINRDLAIPAYTTLDLRAGFATGDDRWRLTFWGRNVTDEYYWVNTVRLNDVVVRYAAMPATYGATLSFRYN